MNKYLQFENLQDFWDYSFRESGSYKKESRNYANNWNGNVSWEEAKRIASSGWFEGIEKVKTISIELSEIISSKIEKQQPEYSFAGNVIDIGMFLSNTPEYFLIRSRTEQEIEGKIITVVCNISVSAAIKPEVIIQKGAIICALVDALELVGYRCEIILNLSLTCTSKKFEIDVCVKKANQLLNLAEIAFCLAHPAMLRRIMFSAAELEGWADFAYGYGKPSTATKKGDIYVNEIFSGTVSNKEAVGWITQKLHQQGVHLKNNN